MPKMPAKYLQAPPFCMQIELVGGCNLRCSFCGLNGIRSKDNDFKFMSPDIVSRLIDLLIKDDWLPRIEFAMHGEPSVHPKLAYVLKQFRTHLPSKVHLMMTSNGAGFLKDPTTSIDAALESLNVLALDAYENVNIVPKILERYAGQHTALHYPADAKANPHHRRKPSDHDLVIVQDIKVATKGVHATLNNHAGSGAPPNDNAVGKRCAKPFREISIRWDGSIALCCNDWSGVYKCGNIMENTLEKIWQGAAFNAARRKLIYGERDFGVCKGCDATSYRVGLLPDQLGKVTLPRATESDLAVIEIATVGASYTIPVLRPWQQ